MTSITNEAVEAAGRAIYAIQLGPDGWDGLPDRPKRQYLDQGRTILEAAAPFMLPDFRESNLKAIAEELANPLNRIGARREP